MRNLLAYADFDWLKNIELIEELTMVVVKHIASNFIPNSRIHVMTI